MRYRILFDLGEVGLEERPLSELLDQAKILRYVEQPIEPEKPFNWQAWLIFNLTRWPQEMLSTRIQENVV